jgi:transcriptional regulator with XRE-family HTH domain
MVRMDLKRQNEVADLLEISRSALSQIIAKNSIKSIINKIMELNIPVSIDSLLFSGNTDIMGCQVVNNEKKEKFKQKNLINLFGFKTRNTLVDWENNKENRLIIQFLYKYFTDEDISQFLNKGKIDRLEWLENDCKTATDFIIKEVFNYCQNKQRESEMQEFGKFLESIQNERMEKTWINLKEFIQKEEEIWKWLSEEFTQYLIKNKYSNILPSCLIKCIGNINYPHYLNWDEQKSLTTQNKKFLVFSSYHRYYYIKYFMWMFMPSTNKKISVAQTMKNYNSLPSYLKSIPEIKLMLKAVGLHVFLPRKFKNK